jgi:tetratricopeptide (TPR) repeat protein
MSEVQRAPTPCVASSRDAAPKGEINLKNAIALHQRGRLTEAEKLYRKILDSIPDHFDAQHLLGVLKHQQGKNTEALELLSAALQKRPNEAVVLSNYGAVLSELNRHDEALASIDKAIALNLNSAEVLYNRGIALQRLDRFDEALANYDKAIVMKPDHVEACNNRGITLGVFKRFEEALASYDKAIALRPDYVEALNNRGNVLKELGRFEEALASYDKAIALRPDYAAALNNRGNALRELKRFDEALSSFDMAISLNPQFAEAINNRGTVLQELKRFEEALASFDEAVALKPDNAEAFNNRGNALKELNRFDEALASYDKAIALRPDNVEALNNRALELMELGRLAEARQAAEHAIHLAPRTPRYYRTLGEIGRWTAGDPRVAAIEELAQASESLAIDERIELHFALAKLYEDLGKPEAAFRQLLAGNALKRHLIAYDENKALGAMDYTRATFTSEFIRRRQNAGNPSSAPIFIVGMPRSGSTLVEQILASHPQIFGGGEMKQFRNAVDQIKVKLATGGSAVLLSAMTNADFHEIGDHYLAEIEKQAPGVAHVTDKMTGNFNLAGLIHLALPNAPIIHSVRDPVDTCCSCFSKLFGEGELTYTYDLAELGRYYRHYQVLMAHWHAVLPPGRILEVRYEDVVSDLDGQAQRIIDYCGLEWDASCLAFHETQRVVRTMSATQVRQTIYNTAIGRWKAHSQFLAPLLAELGIEGR